MHKLNVLIAGSTGYIGVQLVKLLSNHQNINIKYLCGNSSVGKNISFFDKTLKNKKLPKIVKIKKTYLKNVDIIFTALPNGEAQEISKHLSKAMLGPNKDFLDIELRGKIEDGKEICLITNLTNSMQNASKVVLYLTLKEVTIES